MNTKLWWYQNKNDKNSNQQSRINWIGFMGHQRLASSCTVKAAEHPRSRLAPWVFCDSNNALHWLILGHHVNQQSLLGIVEQWRLVRWCLFFGTIVYNVNMTNKQPAIKKWCSWGVFALLTAVGSGFLGGSMDQLTGNDGLLCSVCACPLANLDHGCVHPCWWFPWENHRFLVSTSSVPSLSCWTTGMINKLPNHY